MATLVWVFVSVVLTGLGCLLGVALTRARGTPYLELDFDSYPPIENALPMLAGLTESAVYEGNSAQVLQNGALFPALFADVAAARHTVHFETFVWTKGELEAQVVNALSAKARAGVKVRVLMDSIGGKNASA